MIQHPILLIHNYWGVFLSLVITGFPFTFLLTLSYVTGIDNSLEQAGAMLAAQAGRGGRLARADDVLENAGSVADLWRSVDRLHERYLRLAAAMPS